MTRMHEEHYASAVFVPYSGTEPVRCGFGPNIIGDRDFAERTVAEWSKANPGKTDWQIDSRRYEVWSSFDERLEHEAAKTAEIQAWISVPDDVAWCVRCRLPGETEIELVCGGVMVVVSPTQEAIDKACRNPAFVDRATGSMGEPYWDERG